MGAPVPAGTTALSRPASRDPSKTDGIRSTSEELKRGPVVNSRYLKTTSPFRIYLLQGNPATSAHAIQDAACGKKPLGALTKHISVGRQGFRSFQAPATSSAVESLPPPSRQRRSRSSREVGLSRQRFFVSPVSWFHHDRGYYHSPQ